MIYLIICFFIILVSYLELIQASRVSGILYGVFITLVMLTLVAIRYKVGTDWPAYYDFYVYGADNTELGYHFINNLFADFNIHYNVFLLFINTISLLLIFFSLKKHAIYLGFPLLLFFCELFLYFNFSGIRQGLAISFTMFSVRYILNRSFLKFLMLVIIAACFHITAVIFVIAYFIPLRKLSKKECIIMVTSFIVFSTAIFSVLNIFSGDLAQKAKFYLELQEQEDNIRGLFLIGAIKRSIIVGLVFIFGKQLIKSKNCIYFFNIYLIGLGMYLSTYLISPDIGVRLSSYFLIFDLFIAGNLFYYNKKLEVRLFIALIFSLVSIYKITTYMALETFNYQTIFNS